MKKLLMLLLSVILAFSAVACGGGGDEDDGKSVFMIKSTSSGTGTQAIKDLIAQFEAKHANTEFAPGKKGVKVKFDAKGSTYFVDAMSSDPYHFYVQPYGVDNSQISKGMFLCLDEIFNMPNPNDGGKTIMSKMPAFTKYLTSGVYNGQNGGKEGVYIAPSLQFYGGLTYDKRCYDDNGLYFVNPSQSEYIDHACEILDPTGGRVFYFADIDAASYEDAVFATDGSWNSNKYLSCGPDGKFGTYDDGMASSLEELIAVCDYMSGKGIYPFVLSGSIKDNQFSCEAPMINSLLGAHEETMRSFNGKDFPVVTGYKSGTELWGMSDVNEPTTALVDVTEASGYYTSWSQARYYTTAFWKLAYDSGWYSKTVRNTKSHIEAESDFIFSGYDDAMDKGAMLCDASYWATESREEGNFINFETYEFKDRNGNVMTGEDRENELRWLPLPRQIFGTVTEDNGLGTEEIMMVLTRNIGDVYNATIYNRSEEDKKLITEWILFYYSDASLAYLTAQSGAMTIPMNYEIDTNADYFKGRPFAKNFHERLKNAVISDDSSTCETFLKSPHDFYFHYWGDCWTGVANERAKNFYMAFNDNMAFHSVFEERLLTVEGWNKFFQADNNGMLPDVFNDVHFTKKNGEIV